MSEPRRFRKKPIEITAIRFDGTNHIDIAAFTEGGAFHPISPADRGDDPDIVACVWDYLHGTWVGVKAGHWIVRGSCGEFYPITDDVLAETYETADTAEIRDFTWGQSIGMNTTEGIVDIPFNDGNIWVGNVQLSADDAAVLRDMLNGVLESDGGGDG